MTTTPPRTEQPGDGRITEQDLTPESQLTLMTADRDSWRMLADKSRERAEAAEAELAELRAVVNRQAEDSGLWFEAQTAPEAYLQQELRKLHEAIEGRSQKECALAALDRLGQGGEKRDG